MSRRYLASILVAAIGCGLTVSRAAVDENSRALKIRFTNGFSRDQFKRPPQ